MAKHDFSHGLSKAASKAQSRRGIKTTRESSVIQEQQEVSFAESPEPLNIPMRVKVVQHSSKEKKRKRKAGNRFRCLEVKGR